MPTGMNSLLCSAFAPDDAGASGAKARGGREGSTEAAVACARALTVAARGSVEAGCNGRKSSGKDCSCKGETEHGNSPVAASQTGKIDGPNLGARVQQPYEALHTIECRHTAANVSAMAGTSGAMRQRPSRRSRVITSTASHDCFLSSARLSSARIA